MPEGSEHQQVDGVPRAQRSPLPAGARVGKYIVVRLVRSGDASRTYLARLADETSDAATRRGADAPASVFHLIERSVGEHDSVRPLLSLGLHHPRLLAPQEIVSQDGCDYLVVEAVEDSEPADALPRLDAAGALAAGVGLADALTYLHHSGAAHLHVSPATVVLQRGRAQLVGVEEAQLIHPLDPQARPLFTRDANFLARTLGVLAGITDPDAVNRADPAAVALAAIVERGSANGFTAANEVGVACSAALPRQEPSLPAPTPAAAGRRLSFTVAAATSVGRVRIENQDASASALFDVRDDVSARAQVTLPAAVFLVADGMGGEERGELASRIAARVVVAEVARHLLLPILQTPIEAALAGLAEADSVAPSPAEILMRAALAANTQVRQLAATLGRATGTTLTAIAAVGARAALIHVGDSRAYLLRASQLTQLSQDHTILARLQAMDHPLLHDPAFAVPRNYLYRSLGQEDEPELDSVELTLAPGDRLLLCSDGLWDEVDPAVLLALFSGAAMPQECADALVAAADAAGGHDNSTAVVIFVGDNELRAKQAPGEPSSVEGARQDG
jgi:PPM family protein phosphatase